MEINTLTELLTDEEFLGTGEQLLTDEEFLGTSATKEVSLDPNRVEDHANRTFDMSVEQDVPLNVANARVTAQEGATAIKDFASDYERQIRIPVAGIGGEPYETRAQVEIRPEGGPRELPFVAPKPKPLKGVFPKQIVNYTPQTPADPTREQMAQLYLLSPDFRQEILKQEYEQNFLAKLREP